MHSKSATAALARKHLDRRLTPLRKTQDLVRPARGWIKAIREAGRTPVQRNTFYEPIKVLADSPSAENPAHSHVLEDNLATA